MKSLPVIWDTGGNEEAVIGFQGLPCADKQSDAVSPHLISGCLEDGLPRKAVWNHLRRQRESLLYFTVIRSRRRSQTLNVISPEQGGFMCCPVLCKSLEKFNQLLFQSKFKCTFEEKNDQIISVQIKWQSGIFTQTTNAAFDSQCHISKMLYKKIKQG